MMMPSKLAPVTGGFGGVFSRAAVISSENE
jgi:hypothetical protein